MRKAIGIGIKHPTLALCYHIPLSYSTYSRAAEAYLAQGDVNAISWLSLTKPFLFANQAVLMPFVCTPEDI